MVGTNLNLPMKTNHDSFFSEPVDSTQEARFLASEVVCRLLIWMSEAASLEERGVRATVALYCVRPDLITEATLEEIGHVAIGNHWFHWLCQRDGIEPAAFYARAAWLHAAPRPKPPFNLLARKQAGFTDAELQFMQSSATAQV